MAKNINIDYELRLLELLGFKALVSSLPYHFIIFDDNDVEIGYIQYKNINKKQPVERGYFMEINNSKIMYYGIRYERKNNTGAENSYTFYVKSGDGHQDRIYIRLGEERVFNYFSDKYGYANLKVSKNKLYLNFYRPIVQPPKREIISYDFDDLQGCYSYKIIYGEQNYHMDDEYDKTAIFEISGFHNSTMANNQLEIEECTWLDGKETERIHSKVRGTIPKMALRHESGIASFYYFINYIKAVMPFSDKIFAAIFDDEIRNSNLNIFMNNINPKQAKKVLAKTNKES